MLNNVYQFYNKLQYLPSFYFIYQKKNKTINDKREINGLIGTG